MSYATAELLRCAMNGKGTTSTGEKIGVKEMTKEMNDAYKEQRVLLLSPKSPMGPVSKRQIVKTM